MNRKEKNEKLDFIKMKIFCTQKKYSLKMKRQKFFFKLKGKLRTEKQYLKYI